MKSIPKKILSIRLPEATVPLALLGVCVLAYAMFINRVGFYWDDWPINWIAQRLGSDGLARYFATNRPFWGMIYQFTTPILGSKPLNWQLFALLWRWTSVVALWGLLRQVWRTRPELAVWGAILFAVYPGFKQQWISLVYSHFFIIVTAFLLSLLLNILALRARRTAVRVVLTAAALLLSLVNLLCMEYFFLLELARPFLIGIALAEDIPDLQNPKNRSKKFHVILSRSVPGGGEGSGKSTRDPSSPEKTRAPQDDINFRMKSKGFRKPLGFQGFKRIFLAWLPYLVLFVGLVIWRAFFFKFQTTNYQFSILSDLKAQPLATLWNLIVTVLHDLWLAVGGAWLTAFQPPDPAVLGARSTLYYAAVVLASAIGLGVFVLILRRSADSAAPRSPALTLILTGLVLLLLAGWPFWLTATPIGLRFPPDRFTLPFMFGASLLVAGLIGLIPGRAWIRAAVLAVLAGFAIGLQFQTSIAFMRDWNNQKAFFWQLAWRAPGLQPGTAILANELPLKYVTDNSLSGPLNWIYTAPDSPEAQDLDQNMPYILYYPTIRVGLALPELEKGHQIDQNYLATRFHGSTSQMAAVFFNRFACLRLLDPELEPENMMLPIILREAAGSSSPQVVLPDGIAHPDESIFGAEPVHGWCYAYQKASLAAQQGDWQTAAEIGDTAFTLSDKPNDPMERVPFIEAYAHTDNWDRAVELTQEAYGITPLLQPVYCRLWDRIDRQTPASDAKSTALNRVQEMTGCTPENRDWRLENGE